MTELFLRLVNMSISAGWLVLAVLALRLILKKAPKWVNVLLWGVVAIRLSCPFSIESALSLIPSRETISPEIMMDWTPEISTGIEPLDQVVNPVISTSFAPNPGTSANPLQILIPVAANLWLLGVLILLSYTAISYLTLRLKLRTAVILRNNIFRCETVSSPFVLGILKPKIYLPYSMDGNNLNHVVAHEQAHIKRKDHWWKPLGFLLLTVYWFNPLMWVAYIMLCRDIELACDEKVIAKLGNEQRADYTQALVACSVNRRMIAACPLAFGEVGVKDRVKSIMNYRKPTFWIIVTALFVCVVMAVCFLTDPNPSRKFPMSGNNVSDLNPEMIVDRILDIEDWDASNVYVYAGNFSLQVDSDFNWVDSQAIRYFFSNSEQNYSAQLRIFPDEGKCFLTEPSEWNEVKQIFLMRYYLDAVKYLPQEAIWELAPADQYIIQHREEGIPSDYDRVITYSSEGVEDTDGWYIHLQIQPLHEEGGQFHGTGDEVIDVFYGDGCGSTFTQDSVTFGVYNLEGENAGITEIRLRNMHNGKDTVITDPAQIESIAEFFSQVQGAYRTRSKGYYGGSYEIDMMNGSQTVFSIGFGDDDSFNFGGYGDGYPARYILRGVSREDVIRFFSQFDSSGWDWGLGSPGSTYEIYNEVPLEDIPSTYSLEEATIDKCVIIVDGDIRDNADSWTEFINDVEAGKNATVRVVHYYHGSETEPSAMFIFDLSYNGSFYQLRWFENGKEYVQSYQYLRYFSGEAETAGASYDAYESYILTDNTTATRYELLLSYASSAYGVAIPHHEIYTDMIFYPDYPEIPSVLTKAELYTSPDSESLEVVFKASYGDAKMLARLQEFLSSAQALGYVPKTYRICCSLVLTGDDGMTVTLGLDAESDLFVIDGVFYDYSPGYDEEGSVDSPRDLLGLLGFEEWP